MFAKLVLDWIVEHGEVYYCQDDAKSINVFSLRQSCLFKSLYAFLFPEPNLNSLRDLFRKNLQAFQPNAIHAGALTNIENYFTAWTRFIEQNANEKTFIVPFYCMFL